MIIPRTVPRVRRSPRARVLAALVVGILATLLAGIAAPASASVVDEEEQKDGTVEIAVDLGDRGAASADAPLSGAITVENGVAEELTAGQISLELSRAALADQDAVSAWINTGDAAGTFTAVYSAPTAVIAAETAIEAPVFVTAELLQGLAPGVYPVRATLAGAESAGSGTAWNISVRSVLTIRSDAAPRVALLVPITATPASGDLLSSDELTALTAADGALTAQLDGVAGTAAVIAVDPAIVAAIRVLGTSAPASAVEWLSRLETLSNEVFALQFADADATTQAQAGLTGLLKPTTLDVFLDATALAPEDEPTPSPTPADAEPTLPSVSELTAVAGELPGVLWPRGDVSAEDLAAFSGYLGEETVTVLPSASADSTGANARIGDSRVLVADSALSDLLSSAIAATSPAARAGILAEATAALHFAGTPESGILIGLDRDETRTADALREVIDTAGPGTLTSLGATAPGRATLTSEPSDARAARLTQLLDDEDRLEAFATILADPQVLLAPERIGILRLLAVGTPESDFAPAVTAHRAETAATLDAVDIQAYTGPIQLISANVALPVWIRNDLPWPVRLTLEVRPSDPRIDIEPYTEVEATASGNTRVQLPVAARVASGELDVRFSLTSPTGVPIGQSRSAEVTVRAEWENIGLGVLGGVIVLLLGFGVVRTVRRRHREAMTSDAGTADPAGAADEGGR
ncbi:DUF6049 family protein [Microbacterium tumbae]